MDNTKCIKQEIKEEIPDETFSNEQYDDTSMVQNVKFEDEFGNYEYAIIDEYGEQESEFHTDLEIEPDAHETQNSIDFDEDEGEDEDKDVHQPENEVYVDGEPEIFVENFEDSHLKESASDPLAINTNLMVHSNDYRRSKSTVHPMPSVASIMRRPEQGPPSLPPPPPQPPVEQPTFYVKRKLVKAPPIKELVRKTYSLQHRLAHKVKALYTCPVCDRPFSNSIEFQMHRKICFFKCKTCNLICRSAQQLKSHNQHCTKQIKEQKNSKAVALKLELLEKKVLNDISCNICCTKFNSSGELAAHRMQSHFIANAYACHLCEQKFDSNFDAVKHLKRDH